jgi:hypothetical protein
MLFLYPRTDASGIRTACLYIASALRAASNVEECRLPCRMLTD